MTRRSGWLLAATTILAAMAGIGPGGGDHAWAAGCDQGVCGPRRGTACAGPSGAVCQPGCGHRGRHDGHRGHCGPGRCGEPCAPGGCGPGCLACLHGACDGHWIHHDVIEKRYFLRSQGKSWHSGWYDPAEGRPIALVVPPTAEFQTQYGWGVPSSRVMPIYHQFRRPYPGPGAVGGGGSRFLPTPAQPSDTVQFGVSPVRGPWGAY